MQQNKQTVIKQSSARSLRRLALGHLTIAGLAILLSFIDVGIQASYQQNLKATALNERKTSSGLLNKTYQDRLGYLQQKYFRLHYSMGLSGGLMFCIFWILLIGLFCVKWTKSQLPIEKGQKKLLMVLNILSSSLFMPAAIVIAAFSAVRLQDCKNIWVMAALNCLLFFVDMIISIVMSAILCCCYRKNSKGDGSPPMRVAVEDPFSVIVNEEFPVPFAQPGTKEAPPEYEVAIRETPVKE